jgi:UDP-2,3-diacylglucosamine hydrolase
MRLHDPTLLVAFGQQVLVSHGDALCLGDVAYQRYRRIVRRPGVQRALLALPRPWRSAIGRRARKQSGAMKASAKPCSPTSTPRPHAAGCAKATRRYWCTATPTRPPAMRSDPGSSAMC